MMVVCQVYVRDFKIGARHRQTQRRWLVIVWHVLNQDINRRYILKKGDYRQVLDMSEILGISIYIVQCPREPIASPLINLSDCEQVIKD